MASEALDEKAIFNVARQIGSPDARAEYLRQACGTNAGLRGRVQVLLHAYEEQRAISAERDYEKALRRLPRKHVGRWVRGRKR